MSVIVNEKGNKDCRNANSKSNTLAMPKLQLDTDARGGRAEQESIRHLALKVKQSSSILLQHELQALIADLNKSVKDG